MKTCIRLLVAVCCAAMLLTMTACSGRQYKYVFRHGRATPCAGDHSCAGGNSGP